VLKELIPERSHGSFSYSSNIDMSDLSRKGYHVIRSASNGFSSMADRVRNTKWSVTIGCDR